MNHFLVFQFDKWTFNIKFHKISSTFNSPAEANQNQSSKSIMILATREQHKQFMLLDLSFKDALLIWHHLKNVFPNYQVQRYGSFTTKFLLITTLSSKNMQYVATSLEEFIQLL